MRHWNIASYEALVYKPQVSKQLHGWQQPGRVLKEIKIVDFWIGNKSEIIKWSTDSCESIFQTSVCSGLWMVPELSATVSFTPRLPLVVPAPHNAWQLTSQNQRICHCGIVWCSMEFLCFYSMRNHENAQFPLYKITTKINFVHTNKLETSLLWTAS